MTLPKRPRRRLPFWGFVLAGVGLLVLSLGFGGALLTKSYLQSLTSSVETGSVLEGEALKPAPSISGRTLTGPLDILLLGLDTRHGWADASGRADTIIVMHVPRDHDKAYLMSIPRDALVDIPAYPQAGFYGKRNRINAAYTYGSRNGTDWQGGAALTANTIHQLTGLQFDAVAVIDFDGFKDVVDELGGVHMCVDRETKSDQLIVVDGKPQYAYGKRSGVFLPNSYVHQVGCRDMAGWQALDFARQRKSGPNGDYDRQRHQQQLLKAMGAKASSVGVVTNPLKVTSLIKAAGSALKMDTGHAELFDFLWTLRGLRSSDLTLLKTNNGTYLRGKVKGTQAISYGTLEMFAAAKADTLDAYVTTHPEAVYGDGEVPIGAPPTTDPHPIRAAD